MSSIQRLEQNKYIILLCAIIKATRQEQQQPSQQNDLFNGT